ncbi:DUF305 domain-containing protein [bacterium]|nr:DUF305 domain-containing protein [bacterium]
MYAWPLPHAVMFVGMIIIHVFLMPWIMVARVPGDVYYSVSQSWLALAMAAGMVALEGVMHPIPWWGWLVVMALVATGVAGYRGQWLVDDREFLHDMIPHHSMALLTAGARADRTTNMRVRRLAEQIVLTQEREIAEMRELVRPYSVAGVPLSWVS